MLTRKILLACFLATTLYGADSEEIFLENSWINIGYSNAKDVMLSGATTATAKGYSALFTNPAGLSTNYAVGLYVSTSQVEHKNSTGSANEDNELATTSEILFGDNTVIGLFYKSLVLESKSNIHSALGFAYGLETNYGLFSLGLNYVKDQTTKDNYLDFGTGDYYTLGFQWQKSYIGIDDFYAFYVGASQKGQGVNQVSGERIARVSPLVQRFGVGFETNVFTSSVLISYDVATQSWSHMSDSLTTQALGLKFMAWSGFSVGLGASSSTYTTDLNLKDNKTISLGLEFALWNMNVALAVLRKEVTNTSGDVYVQENSAHADISFAF